jgi:hypothetical protein
MSFLGHRVSPGADNADGDTCVSRYVKSPGQQHYTRGPRGSRAILTPDLTSQETVERVAALDAYGPILWLVLAAAWVFLAVWTAVSYRRAGRLEARLDDLIGQSGEQNTAQTVAEYLSTVRHTARAVNQLQRDHALLAEALPSMIRHVGLVRFSPFHDTGGDQSFALALLDGHGDGVVITALHSRTDSRLYAKPVTGHRSEYSLTAEEREAIARAIADRQVPVARSS